MGGEEDGDRGASERRQRVGENTGDDVGVRGE